MPWTCKRVKKLSQIRWVCADNLDRTKWQGTQIRRNNCRVLTEARWSNLFSGDRWDKTRPIEAPISARRYSKKSIGSIFSLYCFFLGLGCSEKWGAPKRALLKAYSEAACSNGNYSVFYWSHSYPTEILGRVTLFQNLAMDFSDRRISDLLQAIQSLRHKCC